MTCYPTQINKCKYKQNWHCFNAQCGLMNATERNAHRGAVVLCSELDHVNKCKYTELAAFQYTTWTYAAEWNVQHGAVVLCPQLDHVLDLTVSIPERCRGKAVCNARTDFRVVTCGQFWHCHGVMKM